MERATICIVSHAVLIKLNHKSPCEYLIGKTKIFIFRCLAEHGDFDGNGSEMDFTLPGLCLRPVGYECA